MPALDICEPPIIRALEKEGWRVLEKPYGIYTGVRTVFADVSMQRGINGQTEQIIIFEVKCFSNPQSDLQEFYTAIGQYKLYEVALAYNTLNLPVYLALPDVAFERLTNDPSMNEAIQKLLIHAVIVRIETEEVIKWIN